MERVDDVCQLLSRINEHLTLHIFQPGLPDIIINTMNSLTVQLSDALKSDLQEPFSKHEIIRMKLISKEQAVHFCRSQHILDSSSCLINYTMQEKEESRERCDVTNTVYFSFVFVKQVVKNNRGKRDGNYVRLLKLARYCVTCPDDLYCFSQALKLF